MNRKNRKIFIIHEIYGVNDFIREQACSFMDKHTEVVCIHLYTDKRSFTYNQEKEAYHYFTNEIGFDAPLEMLITQLNTAIQQYEKVIVIGYSVGATLAWRLAELPLYRVVCIYGSRIRQYDDLQPNCPTLIILPSFEKSFNVEELSHTLKRHPFVQTIQFPGKHGFMDRYNASFDQESAMLAQAFIKNFL